MPVQQQKRASASKPNSFAALLGCVKAATPAIASAASEEKCLQTPVKPASSANCSPEVTGSASMTSSSSSAPALYTRLPRTISIPSEERHGRNDGYTCRSSSQSPSDHGLLSYGSRDEVASPSVRAPTSPLDASRARSPAPYRLSRSAGDFYRPVTSPISPQDGRRRRNIDSGRVRGLHRPGYYSISTTAPQPTRPRRDPRRDQLIPPWAQRETCEADRIIAELERKAVPKNQVTNKAPESQRRAVDTYRPSHEKVSLEPNRLNDYNTYYSWSKKRLLREMKLRRLPYEHEDHPYLVNILMINDHKFFDMCQECRHLHTTEILLEEAKLQNVFIDESNHWEPYALMIEIADQLARNAVSQHNDLLRAEEAARQAALVKQAPPIQARPSTFNGIPKILHKGVKVKDLAKYKKDPGADIEETFYGALKKHKASKSVGHTKSPAVEAKKTSKIFIKKKQAMPKTETASKPYKPRVESSQGSDSGYSTGRQKPSASSSMSASTPSDGSGEINAPINRSNEAIILGSNSRDVPKVPADEVQKNHTKSKKRVRPLELEHETKGDSPKRAKVKPTPKEEARPSLDEANRLKPIASITFDRNGEMEIEFDASASEPQSTKTGQIKDRSPQEKLDAVARKATKQDKEAVTVTVTARKTSQKRKSRANEDDEEQQIPSKKSKQNNASASQQKKPLKGIPAGERITGMMYVQLADGSYELKKRKRVSARVSDPTKRFIM